MVIRTGFAFSAGGTKAAWLRADKPGDWRIERSTLDRTTAPAVLSYSRVRSARSQVVPLDDGQILLCQPYAADRHEAVLGGRRLLDVTALDLRLVPLPGTAALAIGVETTGDRMAPRSRIWLLTSSGAELVAEVPGRLTGGVHVDDDQLAFGHVQDTGVTGILVRIADGSVHPAVPDRPDVRVLLAAPDRWVLCDGRRRVGWCRPYELETHWTTTRVSVVARPLAVEPYGSAVAFAIDTVAKSWLVIRDFHGSDRHRSDDAPSDDGLLNDGLSKGRAGAEPRAEWQDATIVPVPGGVLGTVASWTAAGLHVPFAPASRPAGIARVRAGAFELLDDAPSAEIPLRLESIAGVPAVVHGDRHAADRLVIALHDGPDAAWQLKPDPLLSPLAASGAAVIAINPRGKGASDSAGGDRADLDDVLAVSEVLIATGRPISVIGSGYGGYLAALALSKAPTLWDRAVLLAPVLSATPDVLSGAGAIEAALLVVVGADDTVAGPAHARELVATVSASRTPVRYIELPDTTHDVLAGRSAGHLLEVVVRWLCDDDQSNGRISRWPLVSRSSRPRHRRGD